MLVPQGWREDDRISRSAGMRSRCCVVAAPSRIQEAVLIGWT
jgi:hypothetical protein